MRWILRRVPTLRSSRLPAPARLKEVRGSADGVAFVLGRPDVCEIAKELYWGGGRRPDPADDLAVRLFTRLARDADVAVDIGAYTGIFTLVSALANPRIRVHAFEIVPDVYKVLFENCVRNDVLHQVTLHHYGIGAPDRIAVFPAVATGSALPSFYSTRLTFESGVRIEFRSLDSLPALIGEGSTVIMKIDVEGTENEVFEHGRQFLAAFSPDILCEVLHGVSDPPALTRILESLGYRYYLVRDSGLTPESTIQADRRFRDWFFTLRSPQDISHLVDGSEA